MPNPPPPERRHVDNNLIINMMSQIDLKLDTMIEEAADFRSTLLKIEGAFPDNDFSSHRIYHQEKIDEIKAKKEFYNKLTFELTKWGLIGFAAWLLVATWKEILKGPGG